MDKEGLFWIRFWSIIASTIVSLAIIISVWNHYNNERYTKMWIECVNAGGQPVSQPMMGSEARTFTCVRP